MTNEERLKTFQILLDYLMQEFPEFLFFSAIIEKDGQVSWCHSNNLCLKCILEYFGEKAIEIDHNEKEIIH